MGVLGLWRLLDPTGKPVPVETLEGKVLAIDVSIWIHQVLQGYQDRRGDSMPNAHLLGLFNRICKLMYFKIKPVFVFDGGIPMLKRNTIAFRRKQKSIAVSKAQKLKSDLISNLIKRVAVKDVLDKRNSQGESSPLKTTSRLPVKSSAENDLYKLPEQPSTSKIQPCDYDFDYESDNDSSEELSPRKQSKWMGNIHSVNVNSEEFKSLPADVRYDILTDLKETRKQNSWGRIHEMPQVLNDFSSFQMKRLLKRRYVQESLEVAEKEMGGKTLTLEELEKLLTEQGVTTSDHDDRAFRIASDSKTRVIFVNDKNSQDTDKNTQQESADSNPALVFISDENSNTNSSYASPYSRWDSTSCVESDDGVSVLENMHDYNLDDDWDLDVELVTPQPQSKKSIRNNNTMEMVMKYMLEHSSLPQEQVFALIEQNKKNKSKSTKTSKKSSKQIKQKLLKKHNTEKTKLIETSTCSFLNANGETGQQSDLKNEKGKDSSDLTNLDIPEEKENVDSSCDSDLIEVSNDSLLDQTTCPVEKFQKFNREEKLTKVQIMKSESSDSDSDFLTVGDVPIPEAAFVQKKEDRNCFNVIFKPEGNLEDDLFADVFATEAMEKPKILSIEIVEDNTVDEVISRNAKNSACRNLNLENFGDESIINEADDQFIFNDAKSSTSVDESSITPSGNSTSQEPVETTGVSLIDGSQSTSQTPNSISLPISQDDLILMKDKLEDEQRELSGNIGKLERQGMDVTDQMRSEAQELLRLFGIPYVVAPMEAEAQCAYLEQIDLTDGTITDDSDIWLFGGKCVYKNFFNNNKRVLQFRSCDIQHHFKLTRQEMIQLALLVGSDYTSGLSGVGPVTAMEVLAAFPSEGEDLLRGLINFSAWIKSGKAPGPGRTSLRNKLKNVQIENGFPSQAVVQAYLHPTIDESKEKFTWGKPNLILLADYARQKFGWTKLKFEEVINPVMKKLTERKNQKGIEAYFKVHVVPKFIEKNMSKRVQSAVRKLGCETIEEDFEEEITKGKANGSRKRVKVGEDLTQIEGNAQNPREREAVSENLLEDVNLLEEKKNLVNSQEDQSPSKDISISKSSEEYIPQRENAKAKALKNKIRAIEVFSKSKKRTIRARKAKRPSGKVLKEAELSESSSNSS